MNLSYISLAHHHSGQGDAAGGQIPIGKRELGGRKGIIYREGKASGRYIGIHPVGEAIILRVGYCANVGQTSHHHLYHTLGQNALPCG